MGMFKCSEEIQLKISVIIPVYNVGKYLNQCVDSVINQSHTNIEIILVDDGSTDSSPIMCDEYAKCDSRIKVIHKVNGGLSDARNVGIQNSTGDYITFLDSDDFWDDSGAIERLVHRIKFTNPDVLNYSYKKYFELSNIKKPQFYDVPEMPKELKLKSEQLEYITGKSLYIASACNKLIRRSLLLDHMLFEKGKLSEDVEWCARLLFHAQSFDFICENFYCYRQREDSITHTMAEKSCIDLTNNIKGCVIASDKATENIKKYIYRYTAYQLSTFFVVQAIAVKCPAECIDNLSNYKWLLAYHGANRKVTCLHIACSLIGFKNVCRLVKATRRLWG